MDRTVGAVDGRLTDVVVANVGGRKVDLGAITLSGGGDAVTAATVVRAGQAERMIADALETELGDRPSSVTLQAPNRINVGAGVPVNGRLAVTPAGDLVIRVADGPAQGREVVLVRGGEDLPIRLTSVKVTQGGDLRLAGELEIGLLG